MTDRKKAKSSNVPGQLLGYSLQTTECLRQLLQAGPGTSVSIEVLEDVAVHTGDGSTRLVQTKSATASNPIANRSQEWWKAFALWVTWAEKNQLDIESRTFCLHVFAPKRGPLVESFSEATSDAAALTALQAAKEEMWGKGPDYALRSQTPEALKPMIDSVLTSSATIPVIKRFKLTFATGDVEADTHNLLLKSFIPDEYVSEIANMALGWVKNRLDTALNSGLPAVIQFDDFHKEVNRFVNRLRFQDLLFDFAGEQGEIDVEAHRFKRYVRQLQAIQADDEDVLEAINSFLRAATNRSIWSEKFLIDEEGLNAYEKALCRHWTNVRKQQNLDHGTEPPSLRGMRLFRACMSLRRHLDGREVPDDFTPGSFHALSDEENVGWHPEYKRKLKDVA